MKMPFRQKIMDALTEVLDRENIPHTGVGTDKPTSSDNLVGVVYVDKPLDQLPPDIKDRIPKSISVIWGRRIISVGVRPQNVGQLAPGG